MVIGGIGMVSGNCVGNRLYGGSNRWYWGVNINFICYPPLATLSNR